MELLNRTNCCVGESSQTFEQEIAAITCQSSMTLYNLVNASKAKKMIDASRDAGLSSNFGANETQKSENSALKGTQITENPLLRGNGQNLQNSASPNFNMKEMISGKIIDPKASNLDNLTNKNNLSVTYKESTNPTDENITNNQQKVFKSIKDLDQLPFEDNSFDAYTSNLTFQSNPNYLNALCESYRVLSKGGRSAFSIWGREENCSFLTFLPSILESHGVIVAPENDIDFDLISIDQVIEDARDIGFRTVKKIHIPFYYFIMDAEEMWEFLENSCHRKQLSELDEETLRAVKEDFFREFDSRFGDQTDEMIGFEVTFILAVK